MGETSENIVINDLLSFLTCKTKLIPKEKLLNCISEYYSEHAIFEAQKTLLAALPVKRSTRHGRRVKHPDTLVAIYDCIQLIPKDDLPIFVCKNLNNVPNLSVIKSETREREDNCEESFKNEEIGEENEVEKEQDEEMDEALCRKEQKEMRLQISKMRSIIEELKDGFQKFIEKPIHIPRKAKEIDSASFGTDLYPTQKSICIKTSFSEEIKESGMIMQHESPTEKHSKRSGLAFIQKLIDEENKMYQEEFEESEFELDEETDYFDDSDEVQNFHDEKKNCTRGNLSSKKSLVGDSSEMDQNLMCFKKGNEKIVESIEESIEISALNDIEDMEEKTPLKTKAGSKKGGECLSLKLSYPHQCPLCKKRFKSNFELRFHSKRHIKEGSYDCIMCRKSFTKRKVFLAHFLACLEEKKKKYNLDDHTCNICGGFYAEKSGLKTHLPVHSKNKAFACDQCTYRFHSEGLLKGHVNAQHNPLNKFKCPLCSLSYISQPYLLAHLRVHTGERPYKCDICGYRSGDRATYKNHIMRHALRDTLAANENGFRFKCELCAFGTMFSFPFQRHMKSHPKKTTFACPECYVPLLNKRTIFLHLKKYCINTVSVKS